MANDLVVTDTITIPAQELEITTSRAGGPGGQHVNKTSSRITVYWNLLATQVLSNEEKERARVVLANRLTTDGYLIVHNSATRSQLENKRRALTALAELILKGLYIPKKRTKTRVSRGAQETRLHTKARRSDIKKMRSKKIEGD
jgi:ribosome-associated protein